MKLRILSPDQSNWCDPPVTSTLRHAPGIITDGEPDVWVVPITFAPWFKFNELSQLKGRRWVLVDYSEFGWDWNQESSYLWGSGERINHPNFGGHEEYRKFQQFILENPPILTFQRELLEKDRSERLLPIEYLSWLPEHGNDTKENFLKRPLDVSYNWSRSHEGRMHLHGAIFQNAGRLGYDVISDFKHVEQAINENKESKKWLSVHVPHYARIDVREVQKFVRMSKVTISWSGCGVKCFRHGEVCQDAIMAMPMSKLAWSYPWTDENSIRLWPDNTNADASLGMIQWALNHDNLYQIYVSAMENGANYRPESYLRRWFVGNIQKAL